MRDGRRCGAVLALALLSITAVATAGRAAPAEVVLGPGDDFGQIAEAHPAGTTYVVTAGTHRLQSIKPKTGDRFVGEPGAILSGARVLRGWQPEQGYWYVDGQTQEGRVQGDIAPGGNQRDAYPEELWVDGRRWRHVSSMADLGPGGWFFSYGADRIWIGRDPALLGTIETSVTPQAIASSDGRPVSDVVIENLVVERYASPTLKGALGSRGAYDWTLHHVTARHNHGAGIRLGPGSTLSGSKTYGNGWSGVAGMGLDARSGYSAPLTMRGTDVNHNCALDFRLRFYDKESKVNCGAARFSHAPKGVLIENSWVHDNAAHGLWMDGGAYSATVRSNRVEDNAFRGIFYEISYGPHPVHGGIDTRIYWNQVWRNGALARSLDEFKGGGVTISDSRDVRVYGNALDRNYGGVLVLEAGGRQAETEHVHVVGNESRYSTGWTGLYTRNHSTEAAREYHTSRGNRFSRNTYRLGNRIGGRFHGVRRPVRVPGWRQLGHDLNSAFLGIRRRPQLPEPAVAFRRLAAYGATE